MLIKKDTNYKEEQMNTLIQNFKSWTKDKGILPKKWKEFFSNVAASERMSVYDLASIIILHPDTYKDQKEYLDITYTTFYLKVDQYVFQLETKGKNNEHILECKVIHNGSLYSSYHSYKDKKEKVMIPEEFLNFKIENIH
jgi:hypothetical protein